MFKTSAIRIALESKIVLFMIKKNKKGKGMRAQEWQRVREKGGDMFKEIRGRLLCLFF